MRSTTKPPEAEREVFVAGATALAAAALLYAFFPAATPIRDGAPPAPPVAAPPPPVAAVSVPAPPAPSAEGLRLSGLLGGGAIITLADGSQRWVALGHDVLPGLRVQRIEQHHAMLASAAGEIRLGFDGPSAPAPIHAQPSLSTAPGSDRSSEAALREETLRYRLGLAPRRIGDRTAGFTVRAGASMPTLERAGLRPGDIVLGVNGSQLNEEQVLELAWTIANSTRTEFEVERGGRRMRLALEGGGR